MKFEIKPALNCELYIVLVTLYDEGEGQEVDHHYVFSSSELAEFLIDALPYGIDIEKKSAVVLSTVKKKNE